MVFQPTTSFLTRREFLVSNPQHRQAPPRHDCYLSNGEERRCCRGSSRWRWRRILCPSLQHPIPGDCDDEDDIVDADDDVDDVTDEGCNTIEFFSSAKFQL